MRRILARAPGRIDLAGGGTDPEPYASDHGGVVINLAIGHHTYVVIEEVARPEARLRSLDLGAEVRASLGEKLPLDGPLRLLAAAVNRLLPERGCDISTLSELPRASGLSSSASLGVALLSALSRFRGLAMEPADVADTHSSIERFDLGIWGGKQDPYACAFGGIRMWTFAGEAVREEPLDLPGWVAATLERDLKLVYSGEAHLSGDIHNEILADYRKGESRVRSAQHRLKKAALDLRDCLRAGDFRAAGRLLDENWSAHQELHESCATERLHELIARGKEAGAWGAKVCGAGGGGCIVFLVPPERHGAFQKAMEEAAARLLPFKIDAVGCQVWDAG